MVSQNGAFAKALDLMRLALPLLDRSGEGLAAARLQHAIETALGSVVREPTLNELDRFFSSPKGEGLVRPGEQSLER